MKFSLINVRSRNGNKVSGYWMQNHIGTIESVNKLKRETNLVNGNKLDIAIVDELPHTNPALDYFCFLEEIKI